MDKSIEALDEFAKGGPYIGPKGGKYADPQHKIPWTDKKEKPDRPGRDRDREKFMEGAAKDRDKVLTPERSKQVKEGMTQTKREWQVGKRAGDKKQQEIDVNVQSAIKQLTGWGSISWKNMGSEMQGKLKKLGLVEENKKAPGTYVLNAKGKALAAKIKKSEGDEMNAIDALENFAKGNGAMPSGEPKLGGGEEQGGNLAGVGKTGGSGDGSAGTPIASPESKKDKLSEDDEDEKKAMKEHKKPIETIKRSFDTSPQGQRDSVAYENAKYAAEMQKGVTEVHVGVGGQKPEQDEPVKLEKSEWVQGKESRVIYSSGGVDDMAADMMKSEAFYHGEAPSIEPMHGMSSFAQCKVCGDKMSKALTACPHCGEGATVQNTVRMAEGHYVEEE